MTAPAAETPPVVPAQQYVDQVALALAGGATVAALTDLLVTIPGVSLRAAQSLLGTREFAHWLDIRSTPLAPPVVRVQNQLNQFRRAAYLINACRRLETAVLRANRDPAAVNRAIETELRYLRQHLDAEARRLTAARRVQDAAHKYGVGKLGWVAILDARTSPECRAAHGKNFNPLDPPPIGLPGTVHPRCRCTAGPPWPEKKRKTERRLQVVAASNEQEAIEMAKDHPSSSHPDMPNKPGTNWVEKAGGLDPFLKRVAKHIMADSGYTQSRAIAAAWSQLRKWAAGGGDVTPKTRAKAAKAVANMERKRLSAKG